jgi:protein-glutamine gamma-glutamyltransferase
MSVRTLLHSIKTANTKGEPEPDLNVRLATMVAVLVAAMATLNQDVGAPFMRIAIPLGIVVAFWFSYVARFRPGMWVKVALAMAMVAASVHFVGQLGEIGQNAAAAQRPLAELFLWTQLFHSFDVPARRDLRFSLVASTVLIGVGGVLSISTVYGISLAIWGAAAVGALALMHRSELSALPSPTVAAPTVRPAAMHQAVAATTVWLSVTAVAGLLAGSLFLLLPAAGTARAFTFPASLPSFDRIPGGGLVNPSLGGSGDGGDTPTTGTGSGGDTPRASFGFVGFSKELDTAARGRPDDTVVMRVRASKPGFWRGQSFDTWDGRRWTASSERTRLISGDGVIELPVFEGSVINEDAEEFIQTVYVDKPGPNLIFGASAATKLYFPDRSVLALADGTVRSGVRLEKGAVYTVISKRPAVNEGRLLSTPFVAAHATAGLAAPAQSAYRQLPATFPTRVSDLAATVTADAPSLYAKVQALEQWLATNTTYSIDIPPLAAGADSVETFLFDQRVGFCEQIASSLVLMLRTLGVPARLGVGYASGTRNPFTGLYEVKASDAHAWTEVYFPGVGWLTFDPTASVPFADDGEVPLARDGLSTFLAARLGPLMHTFGQIAIVVGSVAAVGALALAGWRLRRRRRVLAARTWPQQWNDHLDRLGRRQGILRQPGQTPHAYVRSLGYAGTEWDDALATLDAFTFSDTAVPAGERTAADELLVRAHRD